MTLMKDKVKNLYTPKSIDENRSVILSLISEKLGIAVKLDMLSDANRILIEEIYVMNEKLKKERENYNVERKKISAFIFIFFICFITFIETVFYINTISLLISLMIGILSFLYVQKEKNMISQIKNRIRKFENDIEAKTSDIIRNLQER